MKKILLISNMYPSDKHPYYGTFVKNTEDILKEKEYNIDKIVILKEDVLNKKLKTYFNFYKEIIKKIVYNEYDIIYGHYISHISFPLILLKKIIKKKNMTLVVNIHGSDIIPEKLSQYFRHFLNKYLLNITDIIIVPSNYYKKIVNDKFRVNLNKIKVYPSGGVDTKVFSNTINKEEVKVDFIKYSENYKYVGFVSRLEKSKGIDTFLNVIKEVEDKKILDNLRYIIIGTGSEYAMVSKFIKDNNFQDKVYLINGLSHKELANYYRIMDVFMFLTKRKAESLGLVGLEAMASGVPVIGTSIGGLMEYIKDGINGYLCEINNTNDVISKLIKYFKLSIDEKQKMISNCIETANLFSKENVKKVLVEIFDNI